MPHEKLWKEMIDMDTGSLGVPLSSPTDCCHSFFMLEIGINMKGDYLEGNYKCDAVFKCYLSRSSSAFSLLCFVCILSTWRSEAKATDPAATAATIFYQNCLPYL